MRLTLLPLSLSLLLLPGIACTRNGTSTSPSAPATSQESTGASAAKPAITASVQSIAEFEELIAGHRGKVAVVDLWALW